MIDGGGTGSCGDWWTQDGQPSHTAPHLAHSTSRLVVGGLIECVLSSRQRTLKRVGGETLRQWKTLPVSNDGMPKKYKDQGARQLEL